MNTPANTDVANTAEVSLTTPLDPPEYEDDLTDVQDIQIPDENLPSGVSVTNLHRRAKSMD